MSIASRVKGVITGFLLFVFLFVGSLKVSPILNNETFIFLTESFRNKFSPLWEKIILEYLGYKVKIDPLQFKHTLGFTELIASSILFIGGPFKILAGIILILIMIGAAITHYFIKEDVIFPLFIGFLILLAIVLPNDKKGIKSKISTKEKNNKPDVVKK